MQRQKQTFDCGRKSLASKETNERERIYIAIAALLADIFVCAVGSKEFQKNPRHRRSLTRPSSSLTLMRLTWTRELPKMYFPSIVLFYFILFYFILFYFIYFILFTLFYFISFHFILFYFIRFNSIWIPFLSLSIIFIFVVVVQRHWVCADQSNPASQLSDFCSSSDRRYNFTRYLHSRFFPFRIYA